MTLGVYELEINGKRYIGKDSSIDRNQRLKQHLSLLKGNTHFNKHLQRAYNKYGYVNYDVLIEFGDIDQETLNKVEMFYIDLFETMDSGFNQTKGGDGVKGRRVTKEEIERMRETKVNGFKNGVYKLTIGESNGMNKLSENDVKEIISHFYKQGKSDTEIGEIYGVERGTINTIYNGVRWGHLKEVKDWIKFKEENEHKLRRQGKNTLLPIEIYEIKYLLKHGFSYNDILDHYNSSVMSLYRIKNNISYGDIDMLKPYSYYKL